MENSLQYQKGLGNYFHSEAIAGVILPGSNSPQKVPHGLYAEQISGAAFTMPRHLNGHSWLYRILPSVVHGEFSLINQDYILSSPFDKLVTPPTQMRWNPLPYATEKTNFTQGVKTLAGNGNLNLHCGAVVHLYAINHSMQNEFFSNSDGELLFVPQEGALEFKTEMGILQVEPGDIIVIPRGIKFQVLCDGNARGYICENFGAPFRLPELGPIGASGLAQARDFEIPAAHYEDRQGNFTLINKFQGQLWQANINHSPLNVVAWHGNYAPYKYALANFNVINTVSFDHPDPSIFTVLTSPSSMPGTANVDFVIFPPRWMVAENTFRPPYFHRNIMSEYMGLIKGAYDAKPEGFAPGGGSLHNCMSAHGPDTNAYSKAINAKLQPEYLGNTLAFMFESCYVWQVTPFALKSDFRQEDYLECWQAFKSHFDK